MNTPENEIHELTQQLAAVKEELHVTQNVVRELLLLVLITADQKPLSDEAVVQLNRLLTPGEQNFLMDEADTDYYPRLQNTVAQIID